MTRQTDRVSPMRAVLHLDGGGCGGCALEVAALSGAVRALREAGLMMVDSPRHADLLLVSGTVTRNLLQAVDAAWTAMAEPKFLVAVGACAMDGGPFRDSYAVSGGIGARLPVALAIPGCPPSPDAILDGLCMLLAALDGRTGAATKPDLSSVPDRTDPPPLQALLPAAPARPRAGGDSS
ncbi:MAG: NADH-quinone oxidoreductase subunit B family protein [Janthinobacterium lividum]